MQEEFTMMLMFLLISCREEAQDKTGSPYVTDGEFSECDPLDPGLCAFPFPSSFYIKVNE